MTDDVWIVLIIAGSLTLMALGGQTRDIVRAKYNSRKCSCENEKRKAGNK